MMFASKSPRDLLLTDEDWAAINRGDYCEEELVGIIPSKFHNAPNTILTLFRSDLADSGEGVEAFARSWAYLLVEDNPNFTLRQGKRTRAHAYKVLTRLAALTKEQA